MGLYESLKDLETDIIPVLQNINDKGVSTGMQIGVFSSVTPGSGVPLTSKKTCPVRVCTDDANTVLPAGSAYRAIEGRVLAKAASVGDVSIFGVEGHLKAVGDLSGLSGNQAGLWGYVECVSGAKLPTNTAGVYGMIDVPSGATISGAIVASLMAGSNDLGGTHTGKAVGVYFSNAVAGSFDAAMAFGSQHATAKAGGVLTSTYKIPVITPDGATAYILAGTVA